jgi:hypothetical protein
VGVPLGANSRSQAREYVFMCLRVHIIHTIEQSDEPISILQFSEQQEQPAKNRHHCQAG